MRFHLVDRIDAYERGVGFRARKLTSADEEFWTAGASGPVMPAHLVFEALCQAGAWLVFLESRGRQSAALLSAGRVDFIGDVRPGDVLEMEGRVTSLDEERAVLDGTVSVAGRQVLAAHDLMCVMVPAGQLDDPARLAERARVLLRAEELPV